MFCEPSNETPEAVTGPPPPIAIVRPVCSAEAVEALPFTAAVIVEGSPILNTPAEFETSTSFDVP